MTRPTPLSVSATRKLVLPSSRAGTASTVYMHYPREIGTVVRRTQIVTKVTTTAPP